jgi:hypothetical protein
VTPMSLSREIVAGTRLHRFLATCDLSRTGFVTSMSAAERDAVPREFLALSFGPRLDAQRDALQRTLTAVVKCRLAPTTSARRPALDIQLAERRARLARAEASLRQR